MSDLAQPHWYCIHSKSKCEHLAAQTVRQLDGVETYCPRLRFQRVTPRGKVWFVEALFPSYFFARFIYADHHRAVRHAHQVVRIVEFGGKPVCIPDPIIEELRAEMQYQDVREITRSVEVGDSVEIAEGPMRGFRGIIEHIQNGADRVQVLLEFLGRTNLVEVPISSVLSDRSARDVLQIQP